MRTVTANEEAILAAGARSGAVRLQVKDAGGTFRDMTTYATFNLLLALSWGESVDDPGMTWEATLAREAAQISVAPLVQASPLNHGWDAAASYAPLLAVGRQMKVEWSLQAEGDGAAASWNLAFTGYVDKLGWAEGDNDLHLSGRGDEAKLIQTFIDRERVYAYAQGANADRGCFIFEPEQTYVVGDRVIPTDSKRNDHFYRVTSITTGIAGTTEPTWPTGGGSTVVSGGVTFTESGAGDEDATTDLEVVIQQLLDDNLGAAVVTLNVPAAPVRSVRQFLVTRQPLYDEVRALADQIGWDLRYKYDSGSGTMLLTLYDPDRATTTSLRTFSRSTTTISRAEQDVFGIRNDVRAIISDSQDRHPDGTPKRKTIRVSDSASIAKYGRLFCEMAESSTSNLDTVSEGTTFANIVLSDSKEPVADFSAAYRFFPHLELCDLVTLAANGIHFDQDQKLAVTEYRHSFEADKPGETIFEVRGQPSTGKARWLQMQIDAQNGEQHLLTAFENVGALALSADITPVGGTRISLDWAGAKAPKDTEFELHLSTVAAFTPDSSTLVQVSKEREFEVGNLLPGTTYYCQVVPTTWNGSKPVRGGASEEISFVAGAAQTLHLNPEVYWGKRPLNGSFETSLDPAAPPDFWVAGTWGTREVLMTDADGVSGGSYVKLVTNDSGTAASLSSARFPIAQSDDAELASDTGQAIFVWAKRVAGSGSNFRISANYFDHAGDSIGSPTNTNYDLGTDVGEWKKLVGVISPPSGARFASVSVSITAGASGREVHVDSVECREILETEFAPVWAEVQVGAGANDFQNSWVNYGSPYVVARYSKDAIGWVTLEGVVKTGTATPGTVIFQLPSTHRPASNANRIWPQDSNAGYGAVEVQSDGDVVILAGGNTRLTINARFRAAD